MSLITDLIAHIKANTASFKTVDHAWSMQPFDKPSENSPALFICPASEKSQPSDHDSCVVQNSIIQINLFFVVDHDLLESARNEVFSAIIGWQYSDQYNALEHVAGDTKDINGQYIWWNDVFQTSRQLRQQ